MRTKIFAAMLCFFVFSCAKERRDVIIREYPYENGKAPDARVIVSDPVRQKVSSLTLKRIYTAAGSYDGEIRETEGGDNRVYDKSGNFKYIIKTIGSLKRIYSASGSYEGKIIKTTSGEKRVYDSAGRLKYTVKTIGGKERVYGKSGNFVKEIITIK